jgi:ferric-dicitrate binding protein FerR (iron transport regulator)
MNLREHLPLVKAPESVWDGIEAAIRDGKGAPEYRVPRWRIAWAMAATVVVIAAAGWWFTTHHAGWIETNNVARTTLRIGDIGTVDVGPNTRLRIVSDRPDQHRLTLAHGSIYAKISAPPRLFFVDTQSGTATDLGCEYSLDMDDDGSGILRVTKGWVSFDREGHESLVPAGARCRIRPGRGPDVPYFEDAPAAFRKAVDDGDLDAMLRTARLSDTLTLWNLLPRVPPPDRARIYDRLTAFTTMPPAITKDKILALDRNTLEQLKEKLAWTW